MISLKNSLHHFGVIFRICTVIFGWLVWASPYQANAQSESCETRSNLLQSMAIPFFNDLPYASKSDVLERYGAKIYENRTQPISIDSTIIDLHAESALIMNQLNFPVELNETDEVALKIKFSEQEELARVNFGVILGFEGRPATLYAFGDGDALIAELTSVNEAKHMHGSGLFPDSAAKLSELEMEKLSTLGCNTFLANDIDAKSSLKFWGLLFQGDKGLRLTIDGAGLVFNNLPTQPKFLSGNIGEKNTRLPSYISLDYENGITRRVNPSLDGRFIFEDEFPEQALRVSLKKNGQEHYPVQGRWLGLNRNVGPLNINIEKEYLNIDGHKADKNCPLNQSLPAKLLIPEMKRPGHVMRKWCGTTGITQELYNRYFVNMAGMHDQDYELYSNDSCLRIAHIGHSSVQAQQVPLYLKHNILSGEMLSLKLQRCVYVNTFAGDMSIVSEPRLDWVIENYKPDMLLFAVHRQMVQLLTPELLNATFGYTRGHANTESYDLKANGELEYIPSNPRYALIEKDKPNMVVDDYPLSLAYNLPLEVMPNIAKKSFDTIEALLKRYKNNYPELIFGLEYSHTIAECEKANYCKKTADFKGQKYKAGAEMFAQNIHNICDNAQVTCVNSPLPPANHRGFPDLVFQYDAHYTKLGNYWQAQNVSAAIEMATK